MGFSLKGLVNTAVGFAPYANAARQEIEAENAKKAGLWGPPVAATDENGMPILVQHNATTGDVRPVTMASSATPKDDAPEDALNGLPSIDSFKPSLTPGAPPLPPPGIKALAPVPQPVQQPASQPTPRPAQPPDGIALRPYVKPPATPPKIDPNSPEGIAADSAKAANRAALKPVPAPKIDPNSPEGIAADSTKAVNRAAVKPPPVRLTKIDPNSPAGITADSIKAANRAALRPVGGMTGGMGSGGIGGLARTASGITELDQANRMMLPYESAVRAGTANYNGLDYFLGLRGKMYDAHGVIDQATHAAAFAHLNQVNPDLANYLRAAEMWSLADGTISGRTSDFRTKLDAFVSSIGPSTGGKQIDNTQLGRTTRLTELHKFQPAMEAAAQRFVTPAGRGGVPAAPPTGDTNLGASPLRQKYDAAAASLKAQGKSDAQILQTIGAPPEGQ